MTFILTFTTCKFGNVLTTVTAILMFVIVLIGISNKFSSEKWKENIEKGDVTVCVFLDLKRAFETSVAIFKLERKMEPGVFENCYYVFDSHKGSPDGGGQWIGHFINLNRYSLFDKNF